MAVDTVGTPIGGGELSPVYNPIVWYFGSGNTSLPGFRYVVDVFKRIDNVTQELITRLEIPPRPVDNLCVADIGKILSNYVTNQLPTDTHATDADDSYIRYNIEVRERYQVSYGWTNYAEATGATEFPEYTQLEFAVATPFQEGDQIVNIVNDITIPDGKKLNGILSVIEVIDNQTIVIDRKWSLLDGGETLVGDVIFADGRKFTSGVEETVSDRLAWNGALSHVELFNYTPDRFEMDTITPGEFLTYLPDNFKVRPNSVIGFNVWSALLGSIDFNYIYIRGSNTTVKRRVANSTVFPIMYIPIGPGNIDESQYTLVSGPNETIVTDDNAWYEFFAADGTGNPVSKTYRLTFDKTCSKWDDYQLVFLDRLGSLGSFTFYYLNEESQTIDRTQNNYIIGNLQSNDEWGFQASEAGFKNTNIDIQTSLRLNTAWLNQEESKYIQQLFSSPVVYINLEGSLFPVLVTDSSSITRDTRSDKNIRYEINVKLANRETINW